MASDAELKISQYTFMTALLNGMIGFSCRTLFILLVCLPHDFQAIRPLCQGPTLCMRIL